MKSETQLVEFQGWTLRVRPARELAKRLLLMIHGWTGDENSMWVFARHMPDDRVILAPRAPHRTKPSGYSWRVLPPEGRDSPSFDDLRGAAQGLIGLVDSYCPEQQVPCESIDVIGFSQGAAVASTLALLHPSRIGRVGLLSGFVPGGAEAYVSHRPLAGLRFFVSHGSMDEMVSIEYARQSVALLERAGASVKVCEDEVGHKVSAACLRALQAFLLG